MDPNAANSNNTYNYSHGSQNDNQGITLPDAHVIQTSDGKTYICQSVSLESSQQTTQPAFRGLHSSITPMSSSLHGLNVSTSSSSNSINASTIEVDGVNYVMQQTPSGVPQISRVPPPTSELLEEEPLYVNSKQYHRILARRQARAKLEVDRRIPKIRAKYLHESRHKHAVNRVRGEGGRFETGSEKKNKSNGGAAYTSRRRE